jgi:hypothetical protein
MTTTTVTIKPQLTTAVTLTFPVTVAGVEYTALTMRRCKVKDRRLAAKKATQEEQEITLIANLCEVPPDVIDELDSVDYSALQGVLEGFFGMNTPA